MKLFLSLALFAAFLLCPTACADGVREGLSLAAVQALPALFPFFVVSGLLVRCDTARLSPLLAKPLARLYGLPPEAAPALVLGLIGGYPVGAATACALLSEGVLSREAAERVNRFCNCASPGFCIGLVGLGVFGSAQAGAMLKTTIAFTTQSGSDAYNVIPQEATLGANMRFIPHQGEQKSLAIIQKLAEKHGLSTEVLHSNDFTPPVDIHGEAFTLFTRVIGETFPGLAASPYVMTGATDAQFYQPICPSCIRFAPVIYGPEQMKGMHGLNENIEYNCLPGAVSFYQNLIKAQKR